jgi:hypothetical protein
LAAACRKVSRHARVAWRKRKVFRKSWINGNCEPRKEVTTAGRKITRCAGQKHKVQNKDDVSPKTPKGGTYEKRLWRSPECKKGIRRRDIEEPLHLREGRKTINSNGGWSKRQRPRLESMGNSIEVFGKTIGLQFGKLADGSSVVLWKMRNWTLWRGWPPLKRKKSLHTKQEPVM